MSDHEPMGLPASREVEENILGAMLGNPAVFLDDSLQRFREEHFHFPHTRLMFTEIRAMTDASMVLEVSLVTEWLRKNNAVDKVGGYQQLTEYFLHSPHQSTFEQWASVLCDKMARRIVITASLDAIQKAHDPNVSWKEAMQSTDAEMSMLQVMDSGGKAVPMSQVIMETLEDLDQAMRSKGKVRGIKTGLPDLDRTINGLEPPDMFVIGARPGVGKTNLELLFMENLTYSLVNETQVPTLMFSLEMGRLQIGRRSLFSAAGVEQSKGKTGFLSDGDKTAVTTSAHRWQKTNLWIDDTPELTIADIRARIRAAVRQWGVRVVLLDYIQIIEPVTKAGKADERLGIKEVVAGLKAACKQCGVVMIALAQASRSSEDQPGKRPTLRDFDGSSAIDKWADYAAFIHRPSKYKPWDALKEKEQDYYGTEESYLEAAELLLVKSRHSSEAVIPMRFIGALARFAPKTDKLYSNNPSQRQQGYKAHDGTGKKRKSDDSIDTAFPDEPDLIP